MLTKKTIKDLRQRPGVIIGIELTIDVGILAGSQAKPS